MDLIHEAAVIAKQNNITTSPEQQTIPFLKKIYAAMPDNHLLGIVAKGEYHTSYWYRKADLKEGRMRSALQWATMQNRKGASIYYNVASRKDSVLNRYGAKGTISELRAITTMWCDIDCAIDGTSLTDTYNKLLSFKLAPSMIVFSGGGLQALWVLTELWSVELESDAREFKQWLLGYLNHQCAECGLTFDSGVADATREMRLPGFINNKKNRGGAIAQVIFEAI